MVGTIVIVLCAGKYAFLVLLLSHNSMFFKQFVVAKRPTDCRTWNGKNND